jgi:hypothetical protein
MLAMSLALGATFLNLCGATHAAVKDEVITVCFLADDGTTRTSQELVTLKLIDMGGGYFVGTGRWAFHVDTIEVGDSDVPFHLTLHVSAVSVAPGRIEMTMIGSDFDRSVLTSARVMRYTRAFVAFDGSLTGTGRGFTEDELQKGGNFPLQLTPTSCP